MFCAMIISRALIIVFKPNQSTINQSTINKTQSINVASQIDIENTIIFRANLNNFIERLELNQIIFANGFGDGFGNEFGDGFAYKYLNNEVYDEFYKSIDKHIKIFREIYDDDTKIYTKDDITKLQMTKLHYELELFHYTTIQYMIYQESINDKILLQTLTTVLEDIILNNSKSNSKSKNICHPQDKYNQTV